MTIQASRLLPLEGGFNLRDMGGYTTADGRQVKHGMLYRSGMMSMLTEADEQHLAGLGIATVCDLRRDGERQRDPTRWCEPAGVHYWTRDYSESSGVLSELLNGVTTADDMRGAMITLYPEILVDHAPSYRFLFGRLLDGHVPLLFNCSAGKDRTGVAAALILSVLGVPRETILEDYLLTNEHADFSRMLERSSAGFERYAAMGEAVMKPLFAADADYLAEMYDSLDRDHGGLDTYLAAIGVDSAARATLRELLLD